ncbi:MAG: D-alanyl-D-alanine carboxypeptidase [Acidobacteria bacterium]|nr:D-alanyl-D-alanine carboxypeptidase [Acidobacteriota bacterium]
MPRSFAFPLLAAILALALALSPAEAAAKKKRRPARKSRPPLALVWHVETLDGQVLDSRRGDQAINPASVVKTATTLWALERLGPEHRFETRVLASGPLQPSGRLDGDLVIDGGGDPDFQVENAFLVALELNRRGVTSVRGALAVDREFWIGWEGGSARRDPDPLRRATTMATRLRRALDPARWDAAARGAWKHLASARGLDPARPPKVAIAGGVKVVDEPAGEFLLAHRGQRLVDTLRRMNCFSNNDIERVGAGLGTAADLQTWLAERWGLPPGALRLDTTSGLGTNRLTPRMVVSLLRDLHNVTRRMELPIEGVLPASGCDPGTVANMYRRISAGPPASVVGKTGTLTSTDGGISVFAGFAHTAQGDLIFCVAAPRAAGRLRQARSQEEQWVLELVQRHGGPVASMCAAPLSFSWDGAEVSPAAAPGPLVAPPRPASTPEEQGAPPEPAAIRQGG